MTKVSQNTIKSIFIKNLLIFKERLIVFLSIVNIWQKLYNLSNMYILEVKWLI